MPRINRRTTPKVVDGRVQKKNRHALTPNYWNTPQPLPVVDKERPGRGHRHLLSKDDILNFIDLIPNWDEIGIGLDAVLLAEKSSGLDGWYDDGVVALCAWERDLWRRSHRQHYVEHRLLFKRLEIECEAVGDGFLCKFTEDTARAYQLLHVFLHELGHHCDRMSTRNKAVSRGEQYAERWAYENERVVWERYLSAFKLH